MSMTLEQQECDKYTEVWDIPRYGAVCHSLDLWNTHRELFPADAKSMLDIGCGPGRLVAIMCSRGIDAHGVDIAPNCVDRDIARVHGDRFTQQCIWEMRFPAMEPLNKFDLGVCTDVMEHIPPNHVSGSLGLIGMYCDYVVFKIAHSPSHDWIGKDKPLHLTIEPCDWWLDQMSYIGGVATKVGEVVRSGFLDSIITWEVS